MHALILLFLLAQAPAQPVSSKPLQLYPQVPPLALECGSSTAAVRYDKNNVEHVECHEHLKCDDGTAYGSGACVCKPGMPLLDQDGVVTGCTATAPAKKAD